MMTLSSQIDPVVDQLEAALNEGRFPVEMHSWGTQLLAHLRKPVQVALIGGAKAGKSTLINMMMNKVVIRKVTDIPVIEIAGGKRPRALFETETGSCVRRNGLIEDSAIPRGTIRIRQELPEQILTRTNFVEVGLSGSLGHQKSVVNWISQWADVALWCTPEFTNTEQSLWSAMPEELKDHSFLVLTMADQQMMKGVLAPRIAGLKDFVVEEFLGLYPIATLQAIAARASGEGEEGGLWKSSGGKSLFEGVMRLVRTGRTEDLDQARMLLDRYAPNRSHTAPAPSVQVAQPSVPPPPEPEGTAGQPMAYPQNRALFHDAIDLLQTRADEIKRTFGAVEKPDPRQVLEKCVEAANALCEILVSVDLHDIAAQELQEDAQESAEMMLLFQLEKDEDAATDAVTLLLQLKKEIAHRATQKVA